MIISEPIDKILQKYAAYDGAHGRKGFYCDARSKEEFELLLEQLQKEGFAPVYDRTVSGNRYLLLQQGARTAHLSFLDCLDGIRVLFGSEDTTLTECGDRSATGPTELHLMHMDYTNQYSHDNGLGLITTLADGSFFIIDGGWGRDAENLLRFMEERTEAGKTPRVAAWLLTHSHEDHYGCFRETMTHFAHRLKVERLIYCVPPECMFSRGHYLDRFLVDQAHQIARERGIETFTPTVGQTILLPGVTAEILYTAESYYPHHIGDDNNASTVLMLTFHGEEDTRVLVSGDLSDNALNYLAMLNGETLKCQILQVPHHGCSGGTKQFFDACDPKVALFSTAEDKYQERIATNRAWNRYLLTKLHVEESYCADGAYRRVLPRS